MNCRLSRPGGESGRGKSEEFIIYIFSLYISISVPWLFRNILESVLRDRVEHLLDLSAGGQELGQNSLHSDLGGLGARTANSCDEATGVSGNVQLTQWEGL